MYSSRLRTSPQWSFCIPTLASPAPDGLNLHEAILDPHDLLVRFKLPTTSASSPHAPGARREGPSAKTSSGALRSLYILLLTPPSIPAVELPGNANTAPVLERLTHFHALTGGRDLLVIFLLNEPSSTAKPIEPAHHGLAAHSRLQTLLFHADLCMPIIPITSPSSLVPTLQAYIASLARYSASHATDQRFADADEATLARRAIITLLPLVTAGPPPYHMLTEHQVLKLTDLVGSVKDLATVCGSEEGREWLVSKMDEGEEDCVGRSIVEFWCEEFVKDF